MRSERSRRLDVIAIRFGERLRPEGFARHGRRFLRPMPDGVVHLASLGGLRSGRGEFTLDLAVTFPEVEHTIDWPGAVSIRPMMNRNENVDRWLPVEEHVDLLLEELVPCVLENPGPRFFALFGSRAALLESWRDNKLDSATIARLNRDFPLRSGQIASSGFFQYMAALKRAGAPLERRPRYLANVHFSPKAELAVAAVLVHEGRRDEAAAILTEEHATAIYPEYAANVLRTAKRLGIPLSAVTAREMRRGSV
ncbi:MAG: hypothetical protein U0166_24950 [Acidobacteriota bacterium]